MNVRAELQTPPSIKKKDIKLVKKMKNNKRISKFRSARESFIEELVQSKKSRKLYLKIAFEDYQKDGDLAAFLLALKTISIN
jgi:hypothetical protein